MTSVGVMASSVVTSTAVDVLFEPFNNFTTNGWTVLTGSTIVAGRTGTAARIASLWTEYTIPAPSRSDYLTVGFAFKIDNLSDNTFFHFRSAGAASVETTVDIATDGKLRIYRAGSFLLGASAAGLITVNTWFFFELQMRHHDTLGSVVARLNGVQVISASNVDTFLTATVDTLRLHRDTGAIVLFDDLYLSTGAGATFKGDITIP